ncbi:MAG: hypothetical protein JSS68_14030 [Actinobacteria bacterium]|nr:hypothetical protein [Actinomycetota bacterium]MBS1885196.1 hypothetical protein [Actinomycetota bacterium]
MRPIYARRTAAPDPGGDLVRSGRQIALIALLIAACLAIPGLDRGSLHWPSVVAAVGFAVYALCMLAYSRSCRRRLLEAESTGRPFESPRLALAGLGAFGMGLGVMTVVLILVG